MIHLLTGLPGSGKSLRTVHYIDAFLKEGRPVYACGVDGLSMPGVIPLDDPNRWQDLPDGAVIVVDEAQKLWPSRRGAEPIPPVRALSEHRHQGKDFVLVTQHPAMLDSYVRRLVGRHEHLVRKFGLPAAQIYSWNEAQDDPSSTTSRDLAEESLWTYPKHLFGFYKSATMHTVKRRVPKALIVILASAILIPVLAWLAYSSITSWSQEPEAPTPPLQAGTVGLPTVPALGGGGADAPSSHEYVRAHTPRIHGVPWSAPIYDRFEVQDYPRPHCIIVGDQRIERITCRCYTQQVTPMEMPDAMCIAIARFGAWDPRRPPLQSRHDSSRPQHPVSWDAVSSEPPVGIGSGIDRSVQQRYTPPDFLPR